MEDLRELYQQVIIDHNRAPRNFGVVEGASHHANGRNPLCGDALVVSLLVKNNVVEDVKFEGSGCAISKASASIMTDVVKGKTKEEVKALIENFTKVVTTSMKEEVDISSMGKLAVFAGVREFPARVKCASLAWHTLDAALEGTLEISTE